MSVEIAVCKPDHLGDLVLALPALRQLQRAGFALTLFIAGTNAALARHHLPNMNIVALDMPHLRRDPASSMRANAHRQLGRLRRFDAVIFLRRDAIFQPDQFTQWTDAPFFIEDRNDTHQAILERAVVSRLVGPYDIEQTFFEGREVAFPSDPGTVVLAPGAGFPHKKWSPLLWAQLGQMLQHRGMDIRILAGPSEIAESEIIAGALGLAPRRSVFVGNHDFKALEDWLDACDLVIATDGGSAHLCSLRKPVLSVFGPSPFARFAPIGAGNRAITRALACSPCIGFDQRIINACLSRDCLYGLRSASVVQAFDLPNAPPGEVVELRGPDRAEVHFGLSVPRSRAPPRLSAVQATTKAAGSI